MQFLFIKSLFRINSSLRPPDAAFFACFHPFFSGPDPVFPELPCSIEAMKKTQKLLPLRRFRFLHKLNVQCQSALDLLHAFKKRKADQNSLLSFSQLLNN